MLCDGVCAGSTATLPTFPPFFFFEGDLLFVSLNKCWNASCVTFDQLCWFTSDLGTRRCTACVSALQDFHAERPNRTSWCPRPATSTIAPLPPSQIRQSRGVHSSRGFALVVLALPVLGFNSQEVVSKCIIQNRCSRALCDWTKPTHFWQCTYLVCKYKLWSCSVSVPLPPAPPCRSWHHQRGEIREFIHIPPNSLPHRNTCESDWLIYRSNQILSLWG